MFAASGDVAFQLIVNVSPAAPKKDVDPLGQLAVPGVLLVVHRAIFAGGTGTVN